MRKKNLYEISLIKARKSLEAISNVLIFSFSIAGRLKLRNKGRFNPSRNLQKKKKIYLIIFISRFQCNYFSTTIKAVFGLTRANGESGSP